MTPSILQPTSAVSPRGVPAAETPAPTTVAFPVPDGFLPFAEFRRQHNLVATSTEEANEITKNLSKVTKEDKKEGMKLLLEVDGKVIDGLEQFIPTIEKHAGALADKLQSNGRVFFVGSGSSGRVGIDIAARLGEAFPHFADKIRGVIAGGDSTMIRAKEKFEDSEEAGAEALKSYELTSNDTVILISASGSAKFNVGCGNFAANAKADVFYFYNSENIPDRTKALFKRDDQKITPLCIDIGAQAIAGSTRLGTATLAQCCLGALVASALYRAQGKNEQASTYPELLKDNLKKVLMLIQEQFESMEVFCQIAENVFSSPDANFRRDKDETDLGYLTFLSVARFMRTVFIDVTEMPPTYYLNPPSREQKEEQRPEYAAFLVEEKDNTMAWNALLGREVSSSDTTDTAAFLLAKEALGDHSYYHRPTGEGNFVIGVAKAEKDHLIPPALAGSMLAATQNGTTTGLILLSDKKLDDEDRSRCKDGRDAFLCFDNVPADEVGFTEALLLKQALNIISNITMVAMNKVFGNLMIDVRPTNQKLIDRVLRTVKIVWNMKNKCHPYSSDEELYSNITHVIVEQMKLGIRLSPVKLMLQMLVMKLTPSNLAQVAQALRDNNDDIDWDL